MNIVFLAFAILITGLFLFLPVYKDKKARFADFPQQWRDILSTNVPMYNVLPEPLKLQLHLLINSFLHRKTFYPCQDLVMTDEIRVTIAGQACILLLNRKTDEFAKLKSVLVYPAAFIAAHTSVDENGLVSVDQKGLAGESWGMGKIVLSWDDVKKGAMDVADGHNVVLHEFAHQLDSADGSANGAPILSSANAYKSWAKVMSKEFAALQQNQLHHVRSVMDDYGATNPAEFFAVVTETFFEKPTLLKQRHPELYQVLAQYYHVKPDEWQH
ncbi:zinc-dependent peptidase [Motilimonas cestriensis]|uniref:Zinc-dependent peptidase n=1 Tax=Motilimonas cestriensis TaxID=2742685 RepID=A0ABS8W8F3_9GAMM|nr:M90 family metallopeptidase [Motilimonas cestriensis]MCE2593816.1 zinc-dependent peptidase [Motilimonas cestriensis]